MSEFGGIWKHENKQQAVAPLKTECGCPSAGGIKNGHILYPSYGGTQGIKTKTKNALMIQQTSCTTNCFQYSLNIPGQTCHGNTLHTSAVETPILATLKEINSLLFLFLAVCLLTKVGLVVIMWPVTGLIN